MTGKYREINDTTLKRITPIREDAFGKFHNKEHIPLRSGLKFANFCADNVGYNLNALPKDDRPHRFTLVNQTKPIQDHANTQ